MLTKIRFLVFAVFTLTLGSAQGYEDCYYDLEGTKHSGKINVDHGPRYLIYKANKDSKKVLLDNNQVLSLVIKEDSMILASSIQTEPDATPSIFILNVAVTGKIEVVYMDNRQIPPLQHKNASNVPIPWVGFSRTIVYYVRKWGAGPFFRVKTKEEWNRFVQMVSDHPYYGPHFEKNKFRQLDGIVNIARRYNREMTDTQRELPNDGF